MDVDVDVGERHFVRSRSAVGSGGQERGGSDHDVFVVGFPFPLLPLCSRKRPAPARRVPAGLRPASLYFVLFVSLNLFRHVTPTSFRQI